MVAMTFPGLRPRACMLSNWWSKTPAERKRIPSWAMRYLFRSLNTPVD